LIRNKQNTQDAAFLKEIMRFQENLYNLKVITKQSYYPE
jgi:hypothetical protein